MHARTILMLMPLLLTPQGGWPGPGEFHDYARVLDVEPIAAAPLYGPDSEDCLLGEAAPDIGPSEAFAASIGADVRRQNRRHDAPDPAECSRGRTGRIVGYRVTYRYRGKTLVRRMQEPPIGDLPVRVRVRPLP